MSGVLLIGATASCVFPAIEHLQGRGSLEAQVGCLRRKPEALLRGVGLQCHSLSWVLFPAREPTTPSSPRQVGIKANLLRVSCLPCPREFGFVADGSDCGCISWVSSCWLGQTQSGCPESILAPGPNQQVTSTMGGNAPCLGCLPAFP